MHMRRKLIGHAAVDSGQMMLVDPCYVLNDDSSTRDRIKYDDACEITCGPDMAGEIGALSKDGALACVTSTGWGDGLYPVYVDYDDSEGRVSAMHIHFFDPPDPENWPTSMDDPEIEIEDE
jgi:hypothetical protein